MPISSPFKQDNILSSPKPPYPPESSSKFFEIPNSGNNLFPLLVPTSGRFSSCIPFPAPDSSHLDQDLKIFDSSFSNGRITLDSSKKHKRDDNLP